MEREILEAAVKKYEARGDKVQLAKVLQRLKKFETAEPEEVKVIVEKPKEEAKPKTKPKRKKK